MDELRLPARYFIGALTALAGVCLIARSADLAALSSGTAVLAVVLTALIAISWLHPLPFAAKTKLYLYTSAVVVAVLLLAPGVALAAGVGAVLAHLARREPIDQTLFNGAQVTLQAGLAEAILAFAD